jgi:hypothetical protein
MESAVKANGIAKETGFSRSLLAQDSGAYSGTRITVQQALCKWYSLFNNESNFKKANDWIFPEFPKEDLISSLQSDIELVPSVLMNEFISNSLIQDKQQYIRLVQALLINLSDCLFQKQDEYISVCNQIENTLQFIQSFFYQQFDVDSRVTKYCLQHFLGCSKLKLEYWKIKLNHSALLETLDECLADKSISPEYIITYRKISYLKYLLQEIESAATVISESYMRELFIYKNFNSACFISYEIELIQAEMEKLKTDQEVFLFLQSEQSKIAKLKMNAGFHFDNLQPSVKKQLADWVTEAIKRLELKDKKTNDKGLLPDVGVKIQTTLSVAKLAVLIRLMVVDKIIINQPIAPALRTLSKLFTTLQKDEISFGSLETKYHAPDKATLNTIKEMLLKWVNILGKL